MIRSDFQLDLAPREVMLQIRWNLPREIIAVIAIAEICGIFDHMTEKTAACSGR
jgi:hypothetical protein